MRILFLRLGDLAYSKEIFPQGKDFFITRPI